MTATAAITTEDRIAAAYDCLAGEPGEFVSLQDIADLTGLTPAEYGPAMIQMYQAQEINLVPQANQQILTAGERAAGIRCGGEVKHRISIQGR